MMGDEYYTSVVEDMNVVSVHELASECLRIRADEMYTLIRNVSICNEILSGEDLRIALCGKRESFNEMKHEMKKFGIWDEKYGTCFEDVFRGGDVDCDTLVKLTEGGI